MALIPNRLRELRKIEGYTLRQVGQALSISFSHLCDVENGKMNMTLETFVKLCDFYKVEADFLLGRGKWL